MSSADMFEDSARKRAFKRKWLESWEHLGARILQFPKWMQTIILADVNTAVENRIATMEMILQSMKKKEAYK
jgi:hypothetical protein